jgi:uncharacterized cupredoxin-like copper-binding protein
LLYPAELRGRKQRKYSPMPDDASGSRCGGDGIGRRVIGVAAVPFSEASPRGGWWLGLPVAMAFWATMPAAGAANLDWAKAKTVAVVATEYRFEPNHLVFRRGVAYRLTVVNRGHELHELTAPEFYKAIKLHNPDQLNSEHSEIAVRPGEQKDVYFIALRTGHFAMWCADHDWAGMTGDITVK